MTPLTYVSNKIIWVLLAMALALISLTYSNHFQNSFHFDDGHVVQNNIYIRNLENIPRFFQDASLSSSLPENQQYRPLVATTLALDYAIEKDITRPFWFHASMFFWFIVQCVFLFFFFWKIADQSFKSPWNIFFALFSMTLYGLHTANAETINYISARSDSMSTCWVIIGLFVFAQWPHLRKWGLYLIPCIIACLFKQTAIVFPALIFLYVLFFEKQQSLASLFRPSIFKQTWLDTLRSTGASWVLGLGLLFFLGKMNPPSYIPGGESIYSYLITQPFVMVHYFFTFFLPLQLSADTDWTTLSSAIDDRFFVGVIFIIFALTSAFITSKKQNTRPIAFGILWFFITLLPSSSVIPLAEVMNDHRLFFPLIGLVLTFCFMAYQILIEKQQMSNNPFLLKCSLTIACLILGGFSYGTYQRNKVWRTDESLWKDVTIKSPQNGRGLMTYGVTLLSQGKYEQAKKYFLEAEKYAPYYHTLMINLGVVSNALGLEKEADDYFQKAIQYRPNVPDVYFFYAQHYKNRRPDLAEKALIKALNLSPANIDARNQLMALYWQQKEWDKLKLTAEQTLQILPQDQQTLAFKYYAENHLDIVDITLQKYNIPVIPESLIQLSAKFFQNGEYRTVIHVCEKIIDLNPNDAGAYNNMCAAYNKIHEYAKAKVACEKALQINPNFHDTKNNLANSLVYLKYGDTINQTKFLAEKAKILKSAEIYIQLSALYYSDKNYLASIRAGEKAIELDPNLPASYNNICAAYNEIRDFSKAEVACRKAISLDPNFELAKNNLKVSIYGQHQ